MAYLSGLYITLVSTSIQKGWPCIKSHFRINDMMEGSSHVLADSDFWLMAWALPDMNSVEVVVTLRLRT